MADTSVDLLCLDWPTIAHAVEASAVNFRGQVSGSEHAVRIGLKYVSHSLVKRQTCWFSRSFIRSGKFYQIFEGSDPALKLSEVAPSTTESMLGLIKVTLQFLQVGRRDVLNLGYVVHEPSIHATVRCAIVAF